MIKRLFLGLLAATVLLGVQAQDNIIDRVEWVIGDKAILRSEIEENIKHWFVNGQKFDGDPYCLVGEELAVQQLFLNQAALDSVEVNESFVMQNVDMKIEDYLQGIGSREKMEEYFDMKSSQIREKLFDMFRNQSMIETVQQNIVGEIKVSPALVRRYYNSLPQDSIPYVQSQVEVQIITMVPEIEDEEEERIKSELRDYTERITSGETSFSTLALFYSDCPSARKGGELDFMARAEFDPDFANVAFNLTDPNKVSKIVKSEYGYHIIQLIEKRGDRVKVRHILKKPKISNESIKTMMLRLDTIANEIRKQEFTFEEAAEVVSHDKDTRNNYGLMYNRGTASSRFEMQDLPVDVARVIEKMNVGEISAPFTFRQDNDKLVCAVVKLKSRIDGHKANLRDEYEKLKDVYLAKASQEKVQEWIKNKQKTTFVKINSENKNCEFKYPGWIFYDDNK